MYATCEPVKAVASPVDLHRIRDAPGEVAVRFRLPDETNGVGVLEHGAHAVGDADGHVPGSLIVLADGDDGFEVAVGEGGIAAAAVVAHGGIGTSVRGFRDESGVSADRLEFGSVGGDRAVGVVVGDLHAVQIVNARGGGCG